jgi:transcriptional regulator with XRE-family HTH domain
MSQGRSPINLGLRMGVTDEGLSPQSIGRRIEQAMAKAGVSKALLAKRMGSDPADVSRWVSGHKAQSVETLGRISAALGVPAWRFLVDLEDDVGGGEIDAARRLTIRLTMGWRDGKYRDAAQLAAAAREVAEQAYSTVGQAYVEGWLAGSGLFTKDPPHDDSQNGVPAGPVRSRSDTR